MLTHRRIVVAAITLSSSIAACGAQTPEPVVPADSASASASAAPPAAPSASASASATATAEAAAPLDPMLAGFSADDVAWAKNCLDGDGSYCTKFGNLNEFNAKDFGKAYTWYRKGCEGTKLKDPVSCMGLARLTINGQGTNADVKGGLDLWEATCTMKYGRDSCSELAKAYDKGEYGVKKNAKKAKEIYGKACDLRNLTACKKAGKKPPREQ
jgi:TPR repeat protein